MAEIGAGIIGAGAAVGAAVYSAAKGFVARHESIHTVQIAETQYNASSFEAAYERGDVYDADWEEFLRLKDEARQKEREYDDSIQSYKDTPMYRFFAKIARRKHVRRKKKEMKKANRDMREHYYDVTPGSDVSSTTAQSGSPPRSPKPYSDEDDDRIRNWATTVTSSRADPKKLEAITVTFSSAALLRLPLNIKVLIINEIWFSSNKHMREPALSGLCYAWADAIPFIRQCRFKHISVNRRSLGPLLDITNGASGVSTVIRRIEFRYHRGFAFLHLLALVSRAVNLEELVLDDVNLYKFNLAVNAFPVSLRTCTHLTSLSLNSFPSLNTFSALFNTIQCLPNVTILRFCNLKMYELSVVVAEIWDGAVELSDFSADVCIPWDVRNFNVPEPVSYITGLKISLETLVDLLFLDIISSPKTPFPNVQEITLDDSYILQCRPRRLPALLERYQKTLRILDLGVDCGSNTPALTLPGTLEHFKFAISEKTSLESFYRTLSSSSMLKIVSVVITRKGRLADTKQLDEVLAGMVFLRRLNISVRFLPNDAVERRFPRCVKRHEEAGFKLIWL